MRAKDWLAFVGLSIAWGSSFFWIKIAVEEIGPFLLVALRILIGVIAMLGYYMIVRPKLPKKASTWRALIVVGMLNTAIPFVLISWGEIYIDSGVASILNGSVPLFTTLIAHIFLTDDRLTPNRVIGLLTGFAGVVVLVIRSVSGGGSGSFWGQAAILAAALFYAIAAVYVRRTTVDVPPVVRALIPMVAADAVVWVLIPFVETPVVWPQLTLTWIALAWLGLVGSFLAYLLFYYLVHSVGPTRATMVTFVIPLIGVALGVFFLQEKLDINLAIGAVLVLVSIAIVNRKTSTPQAEPES